MAAALAVGVAYMLAMGGLASVVFACREAD
jgi:hypothetical protein